MPEPEDNYCEADVEAEATECSLKAEDNISVG